MGAPGTTVEGAEKPVMRAVVKVMREVAEMRKVRKFILVGGLVWRNVLFCDD
jgi:hypothetical protein